MNDTNRPEGTDRWRIPRLNDLTIDDVRGQAPLHCPTCGVHVDSPEALGEHEAQRHGGHHTSVLEDMSGYFPQYTAACTCGWVGDPKRGRSWATTQGRVHARGWKRDGGQQ